MFFHTFKYAFLRLIKDKNQIFWLLLFPILLSTVFYFAFSNLFESAELFETIPVAVVSDDATSKDNEAFVTLLESIETDNGVPLLDVMVTSDEDASKMLENQEICGIFTISDSIGLTISSDMKDDTISQSILQEIARQYNVSTDAITEIAMTHPEQLESAINQISSSISYNQEVSYGNGNMDVYVQYFYNLIAMVCLYSAMAGCAISITNQANLSPLGARKNISPVTKFKSLLGELSACVLVQFLCVVVSLIYIIVVLGIDFGNQIPQILLTIFAGCLTGVTFGSMIGSIGHLRNGFKDAITICAAMLCCFLSGLMVGDMRIRIEMICPLINKINPAALITDSFYSLSVYDTYTRFYTNIGSLFAVSAIFCIIELLIIRRDKYASL